MPRDYKNHKRSEAAPSRSNLGFLGGLTLGLAVALGVLIYDRGSLQPRPNTHAADQRPTSPPVPAPAASKARPPAADPQFDFYEMLPKFEVVIPEQNE